MLHSGVVGPDSIRRGGYLYKQNCYEIFEKFFLEQNPFSDIIDTKGTQIEGSYFGTAFGGLNEILPDPMPDVRVKVTCNLSEFYCGAKKTVEYERQVVGLDGRTTRQETCSVEVFIRKGMKEGTEFHFAGKGNETPRQPASDLFITLALGQNCADSMRFQRINESDLLYTHTTTLVDLLKC